MSEISNSGGGRYLVFIFQSQKIGEIDDGAFHAVNAFDDDEDLGPGPEFTGLALADRFSQEAFQVLHIIMFVSSDHGAAKSGPETD